MRDRHPPKQSSAGSKARTATTRRGNGTRPLKVGETVRHALDNILRRGEIHDPELAKYNVTVTEVRMAPDLAHATIFVTPLGGQKGREMLKELKRCAPMLRTEVAQVVKMRHAPELHFQLDESFEYASSIDQALAAPNVKRDLKKEEPKAKSDFDSDYDSDDDEA